METNIYFYEGLEKGFLHNGIPSSRSLVQLSLTFRGAKETIKLNKQVLLAKKIVNNLNPSLVTKSKVKVAYLNRRKKKIFGVEILIDFSTSFSANKKNILSWIRDFCRLVISSNEAILLGASLCDEENATEYKVKLPYLSGRNIKLSIINKGERYNKEILNENIINNEVLTVENE